MYPPKARAWKLLVVAPGFWRLASNKRYQQLFVDFDVVHKIFIILGTDLLTWILPADDEPKISVLMPGW